MINVRMAVKNGMDDGLDKVLMLCMERIAKGESAILLCENEEQRIKLLNKLNVSHLSELVLNPHDNPFEQVITTFEADRSYEDLPTMIRMAKLDDELNDIVRDHRRLVFGNMSWSQLNQRALHAQFLYSPVFLSTQVKNISFEFDQKEYYLLRGRVDYFSKIFSSRFIVEEQQNVFHDQVFQFSNSEEALPKLNEKLDGLFNETQQLVSDFIQSLGKLQKEFQLSHDSEIHHYVLHLDRLIHEISYHRIHHTHSDSTGSFSFRKKKQDTYYNLPSHLQDEWEEIQSELLQAPLINKLPNLDSNIGSEILQYAIKWKDVLENQENSDKAYDLFLRQLNTKQQTNSDYFLTIENKLQELIDRINNSKIFKTIIENNSISTLKKFQLAKSIQEMILVAKYQVAHNKNYFQWKSELINLDNRIGQIVNILSHIDPKSWVKAFDSWYLSSLVQKFRPNRLSLWEVYYKEWASLLSQTDLDKNESLTAKAIVRRIEATLLMVDESPDIFREIFIDKSQEISSAKEWQNLLNKYFPIQLFVKEEFDDSMDAIEVNDIIESKQKSKFGDKGWVNLRGLNKVNKLQHAQVLAEAIYYNTSEINMYVGNSKKYLFSVSDWKRRYLLSLLEHEYLKEIKLSEQPLNVLTEFFLLSMPTTYVYEEFLCELIFPDFLQRNLMMEKLLILSDMQLCALNDSSTLNALTANSL